MPCSHVRLGDGTVMIVRHAKPRAPKCAFCAKASTKLCDGEVGRALGGQAITCDTPMCDQHIGWQAGERDYCPRCKARALAAMGKR